MEIAAILVAGLSLVVSIVFAIRHERMQRRSVTIDLARREEEVQHQRRAEVTAKFMSHAGSDGRKSWGFLLENIGAAPAREVSFEMSPFGGGREPVVSVRPDQLPLPMLDVGQSYSFVATKMLGVASAVDIELKWMDETGQRHKSMRLSTF